MEPRLRCRDASRSTKRSWRKVAPWAEEGPRPRALPSTRIGGTGHQGSTATSTTRPRMISSGLTECKEELQLHLQRRQQLRCQVDLERRQPRLRCRVARRSMRRTRN
jgi:hypothetical protein